MRTQTLPILIMLITHYANAAETAPDLESLNARLQELNTAIKSLSADIHAAQLNEELEQQRQHQTLLQYTLTNSNRLQKLNIHLDGVLIFKHYNPLTLLKPPKQQTFFKGPLSPGQHKLLVEAAIIDQQDTNVGFKQEINFEITAKQSQWNLNLGPGGAKFNES